MRGRGCWGAGSWAPVEERRAARSCVGASPSCTCVWWGWRSSDASVCDRRPPRRGGAGVEGHWGGGWGQQDAQAGRGCCHVALRASLRRARQPACPPPPPAHTHTNGLLRVPASAAGAGAWGESWGQARSHTPRMRVGRKWRVAGVRSTGGTRLLPRCVCVPLTHTHPAGLHHALAHTHTQALPPPAGARGRGGVRAGWGCLGANPTLEARSLGGGGRLGAGDSRRKGIGEGGARGR